MNERIRERGKEGKTKGKSNGKRSHVSSIYLGKAKVPNLVVELEHVTVARTLNEYDSTRRPFGRRTAAVDQLAKLSFFENVAAAAEIAAIVRRTTIGASKRKAFRRMGKGRRRRTGVPVPPLARKAHLTIELSTKGVDESVAKR